MNIQDKKDLEKAISKLQKLKDDGVIPLFADGMLKAYNDLLPLVKKLTTPVVVGQSELLPKRLSNTAYRKAKTLRYEEFVKWWDEQV